jgi:putative phage-type endonuclease
MSATLQLASEKDHGQEVSERIAWMMRRAGRIGASDAPACLGWSRWAKPRDVARRIRAARDGSYTPDAEETPAQHRGHVLEPVVVALWERYRGMAATPALYATHPEHDWMGATPDREAGVDGLVEAKTHISWLASQYGESGSADIPDGEYIQVQHQLAVTGRAWADLAVLLADEQALDLMVRMVETGAAPEAVATLASGLDFRVLRVQRNDAIIKDIIAAEHEFWVLYVLGDDTPPDIQHTIPGATVRRAKDEDEETLLSRLCAAYCLQKDSEAAYKTLRPKVEDAIGKDSGIEGAAGKVTWKSVAAKESTSTNWEGMALHLIQGMALKQDAVDALMRDFTETHKGEPSRRFCVYPADRPRGGKKGGAE